MKTLTAKEEEIMDRFWDNGPMHIKELQELYDEPVPHVNTLSTLVHILEEKGFLNHRALTVRCFQYFAIITREQYRHGTLKNVIYKYFNKSYMNAVSALVQEEQLSVDDLKALISQVEKSKKE